MKINKFLICAFVFILHSSPANAEFKAKVALAAIRQEKTTNELTAEHGVHATQINNWKKQSLQAIPQAFSGRTIGREQDHATEIDELHRQLGQVIAERDRLKKKSARLH